MGHCKPMRKEDAAAPTYQERGQTRHEHCDHVNPAPRLVASGPFLTHEGSCTDGNRDEIVRVPRPALPR